MNYGIIIYEKDDYIYKLVKFRLSTLFPDGYIIRGVSELNSSSIPFADGINILFNSSQYKINDIYKYSENLKTPVSIISLYNDNETGFPMIDCAEIYDQITNMTYQIKEISDEHQISKVCSKAAKTVLYIPFAYISEREALIANKLQYLTDDFLCLRLDLMSGIRMPNTFSGVCNGTVGLTELLDLAQQDSIEKEDILDYCAPDNKGYITPGKPKHSDDVFDYDLDTIKKLIRTASELNEDDSYPMNVLIVAEGFRIADYIEIASLVDEIQILLPERLYKDNLGFKDEIGRITRSVNSEIPVTIHYVETLKLEKEHETMQI